jgi:hypothetical protein
MTGGLAATAKTGRAERRGESLIGRRRAGVFGRLFFRGCHQDAKLPTLFDNCRAFLAPLYKARAAPRPASRLGGAFLRAAPRPVANPSVQSGRIFPGLNRRDRLAR